MVKRLPPALVGVMSFVLLMLNTLFWVPLLLLLALLKLLLPFAAADRTLSPALVVVAESWIACNSAWMALTQRTVWDVQGLEGLRRRRWYLVNSNHQCWVDVFVLQHVFNRRIPLLRFFLKRELMWVPVMGLAWWALDFPFMRRYSEAHLQQHPERRGRDLEAARRACRKFSRHPTSVMNFLEGTRFSRAKQLSQRSPYEHLLKPKVGGFGLALDTLGERADSVLDVTIVYPEGVPTFWQFLCGRTKRVIVRVERLPVPRDLVGAGQADDARSRAAFRRWVKEQWRRKDAQIGALVGEAAGEG